MTVATQEDFRVRTEVAAPARFRLRAAWFPFLVGFAAMLAVGGYGLTDPPLHWDEGATLDASGRSLGDIFRLLGNTDAVLGAYYIFMKYWIAVFGSSDLALRLPALIATSVGVGAVAELGRRLVDRWTGVIAALLCAVLPVLSFSGIQARPYGLVFMLAGLATLALLRATAQPSWLNWAWYGLCIALIGLFHLIGLSLLAAHLAILLSGRYPDRKQVLTRAAVALAAVALVVAKITLLGAQQRESQLNWVHRPDLARVLAVPAELAMSTAIGYGLFALALLAVLVQPRRVYLQLLALFALPVIAVLAVSIVGPPVWVPRYVMFVLGPLSILAAATLTAAKPVPIVVRAVAAVATVSVVVALALPLDRSIWASEGPADTRSMAAIIANDRRPGDVLVFGDDTLRPLIRHYLGETSLPASDVPPDALVTRTATQIGQLHVEECQDTARCLANADRVWLVTSYPANGVSPLDAKNSKMQYLRDAFIVVHAWQLGRGTLTLLAARTRAATER